MTDKDFESHQQDDFVNEMTRLARTLNNKGNAENKKVEVAFYMQEPGDPAFPETLCSMIYYPPKPSNLVAEVEALKAEIALLKKTKTVAPAKKSKH
jgi:hypothetical protein